MKIKIVGSGGCVSTPKPCCNCPVCTEAREKGFPYARTGCSLFVEGANVLIDTPEDINYGLNNAGVERVEYVLYSHSDPDHTMGMRVIEQLRMDWLGLSVGKKIENPIKVAALPNVLEDMKLQRTRYGSVLGYYVMRGLATAEAVRSLEINGLKIDMVPVDDTEHVAVFVITDEHGKVIYAPCDVKPFPHSELFSGADVLIIGNTVIGETLKDGFVLGAENPLREELFVMDEILELQKKYGIKEVIMTHLEEDWGKSYDDYKRLEEEYAHVRFAYDGMEISLPE